MMKIKISTSPLKVFFYCYLLFAICYLLTGCATVPRIESGIPTIQIRGITYLSLVSLTNKFSLDCDYDTLTREVILKKGGSEIKLVPSSRIVLVNNNASDIKYPVELYNGQILVPLKFKQNVLDVLFPSAPSFKKEAPSLPILYKPMRIVIDAGHGGNDPGAIGRLGLREKDIVLDISRRAKKILESQGMDVIMTRNSDRFISLYKRTDIANRSKADLFVSIHANANPSKRLSGFEVYYLSDKIDDHARALVAAENTALDLDNSSFKNVDSSLKATLWDMIYTRNRTESTELASNICQAASGQMDLRILGIKGAPFYVLKDTQMPAVLVEVGFLSNLQEEKYMRNYFYRQQLAEAISQGILNYSRDFQIMEARR